MRPPARRPEGDVPRCAGRPRVGLPGAAAGRQRAAARSAPPGAAPAWRAEAGDVVVVEDVAAHPALTPLPGGRGAGRGSAASGRRRSSAPAACSARCPATATVGRPPRCRAARAGPALRRLRRRRDRAGAAAGRGVAAATACSRRCGACSRRWPGPTGSRAGWRRPASAGAGSAPTPSALLVERRRAARRSRSPATTTERVGAETGDAGCGRPPPSCWPDRRRCRPRPAGGRRRRRRPAAHAPRAGPPLVAHLPAGVAGRHLRPARRRQPLAPLAIEAEALESAQREAAALRRSHAIQREFLSSPEPRAADAAHRHPAATRPRCARPT